MHYLLTLLFLFCITSKPSGEGLATVLVTHKDQNNKNNPIEAVPEVEDPEKSRVSRRVKLLSGAELKKQLDEAKACPELSRRADLETALKTLGHPETGDTCAEPRRSITKSQAEVVAEPRRSAIAHENDLGHDVIDGTKVTVEGEEVVIYGDTSTALSTGVEGKWTRLIGKPLLKGMEEEPVGKDGGGKNSSSSTGDKGDSADDRTKEEKQKDLDKAIGEAEALALNEDVSLESLRSKLPTIKAKFGLKSLEVVNELTKDAEESFFIEGKVNPETKKGPFYKKGEAWLAIKDLSQWDSMSDARQALNYRAQNKFSTPSSRQWHHIREQSFGAEHSVVNLGIIDTNKHEKISGYFSGKHNQKYNGLTFREYCSSMSPDDQYKEGVTVIGVLGYSIMQSDLGRGPFQEIV